MALARSLLVLLLVLFGTRLAAADVPTVDQLKGGAGAPSSQVAGATDQPLIDDLGRRHDLTQLRGLSPVVGAALLLAAVIPLFAGWRLLRLALGLLVGVFAALWVWQYGMPWVSSIAGSDSGSQHLALIVFAAVAFVAGFALGWVLYRLQLGLAGALLGIMVLSLPGLYLDWPLLTLGLMAVGAVLGFVAGWIAAPYWAALQTAILGGFLVVQGTAILAQHWQDEGQMRLVAYSAGLLAAVIGFAVQAIGIARTGAPPPAEAAPAH
jgi:hypothetical protein